MVGNPFGGHPMMNEGTQVSVEPTASGKWQVIVNGSPSTSHNYKDRAVSKARKVARRDGGTLKILTQNRTVQATHNY